MSALTRPERCAELRIGRRLREKILRDPCAYCLNRYAETAWDRTFCKVDGRTWWACKDGKTQPAFELDNSTLGDAT